jgi:type II secretory pathway pseudopilin PulG
MKRRRSNQRIHAFTLPDLLAIIAIVALLAFIIASGTASPNAKRRATRLNCVSNLKQVNLSLRIWEGDNNNKYPVSLSATNGDTGEWAVTTNVAAYFQVRSNELSTPKILICPADMEHYSPATNFQNDFNNSHISYFINPDTSESYPQQVMLGDDNLAIDGVVVKSGVVEFPTNALASFTADRHHYVGNIGYADGSVAEVSSAGLQSSLILAVQGTPYTTNRFAIP